MNLKCYYDENHIFFKEAIVRNKSSSLHEKKNAVYYFQISLFVPEIFKFYNMQISLVMMSYTHPSFDQI